MHELSIIEGLLQHIDKQKNLHAFSRVTEVEIVCGRFNCLSAEHLQFCFEVAAAMTCAKGSVLKIWRIQEDFFCADCRKEFTAEDSGPKRCPFCGKDNLINGNENALYISKLEVD